MVSPSQRPILNRLLAVEPLQTPQGVFTAVDDALGVVPYTMLASSLMAHGCPVSVRTLKRWKKELEEEQ